MKGAVIAGVVGGTLVSAYFMMLEIRRLQSIEFASIAEVRVSRSAERAVFEHLGQVYGLDEARIAAIRSFAGSLGAR